MIVEALKCLQCFQLETGEQLSLSTCRYAVLFSSIHDVPTALLVNCLSRSLNAFTFMSLQMYAPTTLVPARDFWTLRYTTTMEDGSLVVCVNLKCCYIFFNL